MKLFIHIHIHIHRFSVYIHGYIHTNRLQMPILYRPICIAYAPNIRKAQMVSSLLLIYDIDYRSINIDTSFHVNTQNRIKKWA